MSTDLFPDVSTTDLLDTVLHRIADEQRLLERALAHDARHPDDIANDLRRAKATLLYDIVDATRRCLADLATPHYQAEKSHWLARAAIRLHFTALEHHALRDNGHIVDLDTDSTIANDVLTALSNLAWLMARDEPDLDEWRHRLDTLSLAIGDLQTHRDDLHMIVRNS